MLLQKVVDLNVLFTNSLAISQELGVLRPSGGLEHRVLLALLEVLISDRALFFSLIHLARLQLQAFKGDYLEIIEGITRAEAPCIADMGLWR